MLDTLKARNCHAADPAAGGDIPLLGIGAGARRRLARHADGAAGAAHRRAAAGARRARPPGRRPRHAAAVEPVAVAHGADGCAERCRHLGEVAGWTRAVHDARATRWRGEGGVPVFLGGDHSISMGVDQRRGPGLRRAPGASWSCSGSTPMPTTTRRRRAPSGNLHGMALAFARRRADAGADPRRPAASRRCRPANLHVFGAALDRSRRAGAADGARASTASTCGRSTSAACRRCSPSGSPAGGRGRASARELRRRLPRPGVAPGAGTVVPGGATYREAHLVMEMLCDSGLVGSARRGRAQPVPRRARAHRRSSPPSWSRASSAAPCSTASPAPCRRLIP